MSEEVKEPMSQNMKIVLAVAGVFAMGFLMVGLNKEQSKEDMEATAMIRNYAAIQGMASQKCPVAIENETGEKVFFPSKTETDKDTYMTLIWDGENTANGGFKNARCTLKASLGGISELIIDGKTLIKK